MNRLAFHPAEARDGIPSYRVLGSALRSCVSWENGLSRFDFDAFFTPNFDGDLGPTLRAFSR